jgi:hypothetical protein
MTCILRVVGGCKAFLGYRWGVSEIVREEKVSSVSPSPDRASFVVGVVNKTFVVIDALKSLTRCVCSL